MSEKFDFSGLFVFEMANNHQGDVNHGIRIIKELGALVKEKKIRGAVKLQFRDINTFIHPHYLKDTANKHIQRFLSTRLSEKEFLLLIEETRKQGMIPMSTPFDESSVELLEKLRIDIIKIGSCSAKDWPLLEKAAAMGKPMIVSTGGLTIKDVDNLVSFLDHRYIHCALMHCVAIYPTPIEKLNLDRIEVFRHRYPHTSIGFSTHEDPNNFSAIQMAYAKGARIFERHVGISTDTIALNKYSSTPLQIAQWIDAYHAAIASCGAGKHLSIDPDEEKDLRSLMRGVFAKKDVKKGEALERDDVFFAIPLQHGQLTSGSWRNGMIADADYKKFSALSEKLQEGKLLAKDIIYQVIHEVKGMLNSARIPVGTEFNVELSHHYGLERFYETGVVIIDCINREYCKKILIQLPNQKHPYHHHKKKEETFQMLAGELVVELEGKRRILYPGDTATIQRGVKHRFWTDTGAIFEEISTTHFNDDSIYEDQIINAMPREERKTKLINWGRHQFD